MSHAPTLTRLFSSLTLALVALAAASTPAAATTAANKGYSGLYIFGDSISDSGNVAAYTNSNPNLPPNFSPLPTGNDFIPSLAYFPSGTLTNGAPWTVQLAGMMGLQAAPSLLGGTNYAFGGARISGPDVPSPTLTSQVGMFLPTPASTAPAGALYIVAGGANVARDVLEAAMGGTDPAILDAAMQGYANDIGAIVDRLQFAGAQHILVVNTPNVGVTPALATVPGGPGGGAGVAAAMNYYLGLRLAGEAGVSVFDSFAFLTGAVQQSGVPGFAFSNVTDACGAVANNVDCNTALFWDGIHPTTVAHGLLAGAVYQQLAAVPEPATYGLMAIGLLLVGAAARRHPARA